MKRLISISIIILLYFIFFSTDKIFSAEGDVLWTKIINYAQLPGEDKGTKIKLDSLNNIYVASVIGDNDLYLFKFDSTGNSIWTQQISGSFWHSDFEPASWDIDIDASDNIYLVVNKNPNIFISKYDSAGNLIWTNNYNYPGNDSSTGYGIDVQSNYLYITGETMYTQGGASDMYLLLLKYDINGTLQWAKTNNFSTFFVLNTGYDVDAEGDYIYVTGNYGGEVLVVKYSNNGNVIWQSNGGLWGAGYSIDVKGDIFITGKANNFPYDIFYARFSQDGSLVWSNTYNGSANQDDRAFGITTDSKTNSIIIGTIDYDSGNSKIFIQKQAKDGTTLWSNIYDYGSTNDFGYDVAIDSYSNIYVVGYVYDNVNKFDMFIRKYNSAGVVQWTKFYNTFEGSSDYAMDVATDASGNIYVIGRVGTTNQSGNIYLAKYNSSGNNLWSKSIDGGIGASDMGIGIDVDSTGNIYISASVSTNSADPSLQSIMVAKYDTDGSPLWQKFAGTTNDNDAGRIAVDNSGNIYVTGYIGTSSTNNDIWIRKYDNNGNEQWTKTHNNTSLADSDDEGIGIWVDNKGYLYVSGVEEQSGERKNIWVRKMDVTDGSEIWTRTYNNAAANNDDVGYAVCVDTSDNVIAGGLTEQTTSGDYDGWLRQYTSNGATNWTKIKSSSQHIEAIFDLTVDSNGNIYATGVTNYDPISSIGPIWVAKYNSSGNIQWSRGYNNPAGGNMGYGITLAPDNTIIVVGKDGGNNGDIWIRKYAGASVGEVVSTESTLDNVYIYPNPVYGDTTFTITKLTKEATLKIYNIKGELIKEINKDSNQSEISLRPTELNLSTGVYFLYMESNGNKSIIKKLIYIK